MHIIWKEARGTNLDILLRLGVCLSMCMYTLIHIFIVAFQCTFKMHVLLIFYMVNDLSFYSILIGSHIPYNICTNISRPLTDYLHV